MRHFSEQTSPGGVILLVFLEVLREKLDRFCENGNLDLRGAGILLVGLVLLDEPFLRSALESHSELERQKRWTPGHWVRSRISGARTVKAFYGSQPKKQGRAQ